MTARVSHVVYGGGQFSNGLWRSLVALPLWVREVAGSNPASPTTLRDSERFADSLRACRDHRRAREKSDPLSLGYSVRRSQRCVKVAGGRRWSLPNGYMRSGSPHEGPNQPTCLCSSVDRAPGFYPAGRGFESFQGHGLLAQLAEAADSNTAQSQFESGVGHAPLWGVTKGSSPLMTSPWA